MRGVVYNRNRTISDSKSIRSEIAAMGVLGRSRNWKMRRLKSMVRTLKPIRGRRRCVCETQLHFRYWEQKGKHPQEIQRLGCSTNIKSIFPQIYFINRNKRRGKITFNVTLNCNLTFPILFEFYWVCFKKWSKYW